MLIELLIGRFQNVKIFTFTFISVVLASLFLHQGFNIGLAALSAVIAALISIIVSIIIGAILNRLFRG